MVNTMSIYKNMTASELSAVKEDLLSQYNEYKEKNLNLDMSRGKPSPSQLDGSMELLDTVNTEKGYKTSAGFDCRNYGVLEGIPEARQLFADILGVKAENILVGGSSSLTMMYDALARAFTHGVYGSEKPWSQEGKLKFLCPAPGYDRHFAMTEFFGFELITIPMTETGPDMDMVEEYVNNDPTVKGIWCVPKYSNPEGGIYSNETVTRFAKLKPAAKDFRIFWDNAYCIHHIYGDGSDVLLNIFDECEKYGSSNMVYEFASTSKVTFPGAGVACIAASVDNIKDIKSKIFFQSISADKINMLRHVRYFDSMDKVKSHMQKMADALLPRFDAVLNSLEKELAPLEIASWKKPKGGYFVSFTSEDNCAKDIVATCKELGVVLTGAGATYPYGKDPKDSNIRLAPSFPTVEELQSAMEVFCLAVKLVTVNKELAAR